MPVLVFYRVSLPFAGGLRRPCTSYTGCKCRGCPGRQDQRCAYSIRAQQRTSMTGSVAPPDSWSWLFRIAACAAWLRLLACGRRHRGLRIGQASPPASPTQAMCLNFLSLRQKARRTASVCTKTQARHKTRNTTSLAIAPSGCKRRRYVNVCRRMPCRVCRLAPPFPASAASSHAPPPACFRVRRRVEHVSPFGLLFHTSQGRETCESPARMAAIFNTCSMNARVTSYRGISQRASSSLCALPSCVPRHEATSRRVRSLVSERSHH